MRTDFLNPLEDMGVCPSSRHCNLVSVGSFNTLRAIESCMWEPRKDYCISPTVSTSEHGLDISCGLSCHGQSLPGCYFHSGALQRMSPKLVTQLFQSRTCFRTLLVLGGTEHQVSRGFLSDLALHGSSYLYPLLQALCRGWLRMAADLEPH